MNAIKDKNLLLLNSAPPVARKCLIVTFSAMLAHFSLNVAVEFYSFDGFLSVCLNGQNEAKTLPFFLIVGVAIV